MGVGGGAERYALHRTGAQTWTIEDHTQAPGRPERVLARIGASSENYVDVEWTAGIPLPTHYMTARYALEDLTRWAATPRGPTRPIPIPHFPPPASRSARH